MKYGKIISIKEGSLAEELELVPGDKIVEVNGTPLRDIIDLSFAFADEEIDMLVEHEDGEQEIFSFDKDYDEELGVEFDSAVFDGIRACANNCCFCFVDQVAPHMRNSLHIKDDDYRMSFLYGNFITMTNMGERDFQRIAQYHLSPLFISVQATDNEIRERLLRCKNANKLASQLDRLATDDIEYHTQIVLCRDINDGDILRKSLEELINRQPHALSVAIVPVGLTKFRQDRYPLEGFDKETAQRVIEQVEPLQQEERKKHGRTFIYLGDEFYFLAEREVPPAEYYDGFPQLDNGIGLARNFIEEFSQAQRDRKEAINEGKGKLLVISGTAIAPLLEKLVINNLPDLRERIEFLPVKNEYFGTTVNVSGLLTAKDILKQLPEKRDAFTGILIPESCIRAGDNVFLDDITLEEFSQQLPCRVETVGSGRDYYEALTAWESYTGIKNEAGLYMWQSNAAYTKRGGK